MKKAFLKIIPVILTVILITATLPVTGAAAAWDGKAAAAFDGGSGSAASPYIIKTAAQLAYLASLVNAGDPLSGIYFELGADIDLGGSEWTPIGGSNLPFSGNFNGKGHTISNCTVNSSATPARIGLFGIISNGQVKNIHMVNASINSAASTGVWLGTITGSLTGTEGVISGCTADASSKVTLMGSVSAGGIAGRVENGSVLEYCINYASVESGSGTTNIFSGGLVGCAGSNATVRYSANYGKVDSKTKIDLLFAQTGFYTGGIVGCFGASSTGGTIEYCYNAGSVASVYAAGGIAGRTHTVGDVIKNSYNISADITVGMTDNNAPGTIVGWLANTAEFSNCMSIEVTGANLIGNNSINQTDLSGTAIKTNAEIKALTGAIDAEIQKNMIKLPDPGVTTTAPVTTVTAPGTTAPTTTAAAGTTTAGTSAISPGSTPPTADISVLISIFMFASALTALAVLIGKRKSVK